jgi:hypothetical protein
MCREKTTLLGSDGAIYTIATSLHDFDVDFPYTINATVKDRTIVSIAVSGSKY